MNNDQDNNRSSIVISIGNRDLTTRSLKLIRRGLDDITRQEKVEKIRLQILVVEDDLAMRIAIRDVLTNQGGYEVKAAANGKEGFYLYKKYKPDLILSGIAMPVMDGFMLLEEVRKHPEGATIPFVFLTAKGRREQIFYGNSLGVDDYLVKPVTREELLAAIEAQVRSIDERLQSSS